MNVVAKLLPAMTLALTLAACARSNHAVRTVYVPVPSPEQSTKTPGGTTEANARSAAQNPADRYLILAADGKCSDRLVKLFAQQSEVRRTATAIVKVRIGAYERIKPYPNMSILGVNLQLRLTQLQDAYTFLINTTQAFEDRFADFTTCVRRSDGVVLSHAELNAGMAELKSYVEALGPLPKPKIVPLIEE